jgi:hypothetical protein
MSERGSTGPDMGMNMRQDWMKYLMIGSFAVAAYLIFSNKRPAGFAVASIGLAMLASEHPDKVQEVWHRAPEFLDRGQRMVQGVSGIVEKVAESTSKFQNMRRGREQGHDYLT